MKPILTAGKADLRAACHARDDSLKALKGNPVLMGYAGSRAYMRQWALSWRKAQYAARIRRAKKT